MIGHDKPSDSNCLDIDSTELYNQCRELIKYGAVLINLCMAKIKNGEIKKIDSIKKIKEIVARLNNMYDDLKEINKYSQFNVTTEIEQLNIITAVGDKYNNWIYNFTNELMPELETIRQILELDGGTDE